jgi:hypothetical protein
MGPSRDRKPRTVTPARARRQTLAMPPPATRIAVSRADERPPPR